MNYKISTIVPVYNSEKYLSKCIESLINQTYKNIEIIIVDDGSTDNSLNIIKKYAKNDSRIKYYHQENKGGNVALNFGLSKTTGDLIHFLDADDYIETNAYKIITKKFNKNPEIDSCFFGYREIDENGDLLKYGTYDKPICTSLYENPKTLLWLSSAQWRKITKKDLLIKNNIKFDDTPFGYDVFFHLNICKYAKKIQILSNQFVYYRVGMQSSSSGKLTRSKNYYIHSQCFDHCVNLYKDMPKNIYYLNIISQFKIFYAYFINSTNEYKLKNYFILRDFTIKLKKDYIDAILSNEKSKNMYYEIINYSYIKNIIKDFNLTQYEELNDLRRELTSIKNSRSYKLTKKLSNIKRKFLK